MRRIIWLALVMLITTASCKAEEPRVKLERIEMKRFIFLQMDTPEGAHTAKAFSENGEWTTVNRAGDGEVILDSWRDYKVLGKNEYMVVFYDRDGVEIEKVAVFGTGSNWIIILQDDEEHIDSGDRGSDGHHFFKLG